MSYKAALRAVRTDGGPFANTQKRSLVALRIVQKVQQDLKDISIRDNRTMVGLLTARFLERAELMVRVEQGYYQEGDDSFVYFINTRERMFGLCFVERPDNPWATLYCRLL